MSDSEDELLDKIMCSLNGGARHLTVEKSHESPVGSAHSDDDSMAYFDRLELKMMNQDLDGLSVNDLEVSKCLLTMDSEEAALKQDAMDSENRRLSELEDELFLENGDCSDVTDEDFVDVEETLDTEDPQMSNEIPVCFEFNSPAPPPHMFKNKSSGLIPEKFWGPNRSKSDPISLPLQSELRDTSDRGMKNSIYQTKLMAMQDLSCSAGKNVCEYGGNCIGRTTLQEIIELRTEFWGDAFKPAPKAKERKKRIEQYLVRAHNQHKNSFTFRIGEREVCEKALLIILGLVTTNRPPRIYMEKKAEFTSGAFYDELLHGKKGLDATDKSLKKLTSKRADKSQHAERFIEWLTTIFADSCPTDPDKKFLPYENVSQMFAEYTAFCDSHLIHQTKRCCLETFRTAFRKMEAKIHLARAKGSFPTCDICNNANDMLRQGQTRFNKTRREIILKFKRCHLLQQAQERKHQELTRLKAKTEIIAGQPQNAYILIDGMTVMSGNTPKVGGGNYRHSKEDTAHVTNRVVGVEVVCGPIDTTFFYHTDDTVSSGANTMIEIVRQTISDLSQKLRELEHPVLLPQKISLQFDNCGENKNKYMFSYLSLLVESHQFEEIEVNFLIVGHTHTTIDQYFGVISDRINDCKFIGSPVALWHLIQHAHPDKKKQPSVQKQIFVVHDYKSYLTPYINTIKYYQVPHCFWIRRLYSKAYMQYKLFSNHTTWLPVPPDNLSPDEMAYNLLHEVELQPMCTVGSRQEFIDSLQLTGASETVRLAELATNEDALNSINLLSEMTPELTVIEEKGIDQLLQRCTDEEENGILGSRARYESTSERLKIVENYLRRRANNSQGYMMWLKSTDSSGRDLPYILDVLPKPLITLDTCTAILSSLPVVVAPSLKSKGNKESDSDQSDTEQQRRGGQLSSANTLIRNKFKTLEKAARSVFKNLHKKRFTISSKNPQINAMNVNFTREFKLVKATSGSSSGIDISDSLLEAVMNETPNYLAMELTVWEIVFYNKISTARNAVERYMSELLALPTFTLIPESALTDAQLEVIQQRREQTYYEEQREIELANNLLTKNKHTRADGEDIIEAMLGVPVRRNSSQTVQRSRCSVTGCTGFATKECKETAECSQRMYCDRHGQSHGAHKDCRLKRMTRNTLTSPPISSCAVIMCTEVSPYQPCQDCPQSAPCSSRLFCGIHSSSGHASHYCQRLTATATASVPAPLPAPVPMPLPTAPAPTPAPVPMPLPTAPAPTPAPVPMPLPTALAPTPASVPMPLPTAPAPAPKPTTPLSPNPIPVSVSLPVQVAAPVPAHVPPPAPASVTDQTVTSSTDPLPVESSDVLNPFPARIRCKAGHCRRYARIECKECSAGGFYCNEHKAHRYHWKKTANHKECDTEEVKQVEMEIEINFSAQYSGEEAALLDRFEKSMKNELEKPLHKRDYKERMISEFNHGAYSSKLPVLSRHYGIDIAIAPLSSEANRITFLEQFVPLYAAKHGLEGYIDENSEGRRKRKRKGD